MYMRRVLAIAVALTVMVAGPAAADPVDDSDVAAAHDAVAAATTDVAQIELDLALQQTALDEAWVAVAMAGEQYATAEQASADAAKAQVDANAKSREASAALNEAEGHLAAIVAEVYRSGGSLDKVGALMSADGFDDYAHTSATMDLLGDRTERALQQVEAATLVATTLARIAEEAAAQAEAAKAEAAVLLGVADQAREMAEAKVNEVAAQRELLIARLAEARNTSIEVEAARQAQLDAERQAREDAAALADHEANQDDNSGADQSDDGATDGNDDSDAGQGDGGGSGGGSRDDDDSGNDSGAGSNPGGSWTTSASQGQEAVDWALTQVGKPYVYGATGLGSYDCSGLTQRSWSNAGFALNRTSRDQYRQVTKISYSSMRPGDLIFWGNNPSDAGSVYHVAMYIGDGQMVEAPRPGLTVRVTSVRWSNTMSYAGRP